MPINPAQYTDKNAARYSLPMDSCVGDDGPSPMEVTVISKGSGAASGARDFSPAGGSVTAGGGKGKSRGQRATENWIPGRPGMGADVPVGYDGP